MATAHRKRRKIYDTPGDPHFVTFSCYQRQKLLSKDRTRQYVTEAIAKSQETVPFDLWAYVIMPEHVHLVVLPRENSEMASILKSIKQSVSRRAVNWLRENSPQFLVRLEEQKNGIITYRFWQRGGGYDRNLRSVRDIHEKINYTHENPVRRGLAKDATLWKWSSALAWESDTNIPLAIQRNSVPPLLASEGRSSLRRWT
ncbi:REP-associated tyrosine transposase [Bremerella sp. P1]|uniref:REP-associated tyrosine transposase n=1 Tax=Bremerella sp. P1 TaxID=3026424 RepID=UPI002368D2EE|nr:transposase [Bremerella sp. P1]WDI44871.1 transposase [Bremerella sp. P1]